MKTNEDISKAPKCKRVVFCYSNTKPYFEWSRHPARCTNPCAVCGYPKHRCLCELCKKERARYTMGFSPAKKPKKKVRMIDLNDCWLYLGGPRSYGPSTVEGYGMYNRTMAHRASYEIYKGPIPEGLEIDHLCRNRRCINPDHLEPVTRKENILRGESPTATNKRKTHCPNGHLYDFIRPNGERECRSCHRVNYQRYYQKLSLRAGELK